MASTSLVYLLVMEVTKLTAGNFYLIPECKSESLRHCDTLVSKLNTHKYGRTKYLYQKN